jgi:hypothetical protein
VLGSLIEARSFAGTRAPLGEHQPAVLHRLNHEGPSHRRLTGVRHPASTHFPCARRSGNAPRRRILRLLIFAASDVSAGVFSKRSFDFAFDSGNNRDRDEGYKVLVSL